MRTTLVWRQYRVGASEGEVGVEGVQGEVSEDKVVWRRYRVR